MRLGIILAATLLVCGCSTAGLYKEITAREEIGAHGCGQKYEVKWHRK